MSAPHIRSWSWKSVTCFALGLALAGAGAGPAAAERRPGAALAGEEIEVVAVSGDTPLVLDFRGEDPSFSLRSTIQVRRIFELREVRVGVRVERTDPTLMRVTLTSPQGTRIVLVERGTEPDDPRRILDRTFVLPTQLAGRIGAGTWELEVDFGGFDMVLRHWQLNLSGIAGPEVMALTASPAAATVRQGERSRHVVHVDAFAPIAGPIALTAASEPPLSAALTFDAPSVAASDLSLLEVATDCTTAPGTYTLMLAGAGAASDPGRVALTVEPAGATPASGASEDTPLPIPDASPAGAASVVEVTQDVTPWRVTADVEIHHWRREDLTLALIAPDGRRAVLRDGVPHGPPSPRGETFEVRALVGAPARGLWRLEVVDGAAGYDGLIERWSLRLIGVPRVAPTAGFTHEASGGELAFRDESRDAHCGALASWAWDFGDGATSEERDPVHTYAAAA